MEIKAGDIYIAALEMEHDQNPYKKRPIVILHLNKLENTLIIAPITSVSKKGPYLKDYIYINHEYYGLLKESFIPTNRIYTISKDRLFQKISRLSNEDMKKLESAIINTLSPEIFTDGNSDEAKLEVYKNFALIGPKDKLDELKRYLNEFKSTTWAIDDSSKFPDFILFKKRGKVGALLFLSDNEGKFEISNIVPTEKNTLTYDEYNSIIDEFHSDVIAPFINSTGSSIEVKKSLSQVSIEKYLSPENAGKLKTFSAAANKATGSAHPLDRRRWFDFITSSFQQKDIIDSGILHRWLIEVECWSDEIAIQLVCEYENSIQLLDFYAERITNDKE